VSDKGRKMPRQKCQQGSKGDVTRDSSERMGFTDTSQMGLDLEDGNLKRTQPIQQCNVGVSVGFEIVNPVTWWFWIKGEDVGALAKFGVARRGRTNSNPKG